MPAIDVGVVYGIVHVSGFADAGGMGLSLPATQAFGSIAFVVNDYVLLRSAECLLARLFLGWHKTSISLVVSCWHPDVSAALFIANQAEPFCCSTYIGTVTVMWVASRPARLGREHVHASTASRALT